MQRTRLTGLILIFSLALSGCGGGSGVTPSGGTQPGAASSGSSTANAVIQVTSGVTINPLNHDMQTVVGTAMQLSAAGSTDKGSTISTYDWTVTARPSSSAAQPSSSSAKTTSFTPDQIGVYTLALKVTDAQGASSTQDLSVVVTDAAPSMSVVTMVSFASVTSTKPPQQVDLGSIITLDASGASTSGTSPLTINWVLASKPATSTITLPATGTTVHFTADVVGEYDIHVIATDATGAYAETDYVYQANPAPSAVVVASVTSATGLAGSIQAVTNYLVVLDGSGSSVASSDTSTSVWTLVSKPSGSATTLAKLSGANTNFIPDIAGDYIVTLTFTDTTLGLTSTFTMTVHVAQGPVAIISGSAGPVAVASAPTFASAPGEMVSLLGGGSYEVGGGSLTYAWAITTAPSGSSATIASPTAMNTTFTPDLIGSYVIQLTVSDTTGAAAVTNVTVQVGPHAPVAVLNRSQASVLLGGAVTDSAALSYDPNGYALTYSWAILAAPSGSTATISGSTTTAAVSFTPDVGGTYTLSVTVSNGSQSAIGQFTITAFSASAGTVPLSYKPLFEKYNRATDKLIMVSTDPNALHIVNLKAATDTAVALPSIPDDLGVSPDGTLAAVVENGAVSVINLTTGTLENTWSTVAPWTTVQVSNAGLIYMTGVAGGQWFSPGMQVMNASNGSTFQSYNVIGSFWGTMHSVFADLSNQIFVVSDGLSPTQTYSVALDSSGTSTNGQVTGTTGSPYWGTYSMGAPMWLSSDQSLLFTAGGTYFSTSGLTYQGTLGLNVSYSAPLISVSDDTTLGEAVALTETTTGYYPYTYHYPDTYQMFASFPLTLQGSIPLPLVAGLQSYGLAMFHSSDDKHVMVVQTGTDEVSGAGATYYALLR